MTTWLFYKIECFSEYVEENKDFFIIYILYSNNWLIQMNHIYISKISSK